MVAWMPSSTYNYYVEYVAHSTPINTPSSIYVYATNELHVKEILADYKVLLIEKQE